MCLKKMCWAGEDVATGCSPAVVEAAGQYYVGGQEKTKAEV